MNALPDLAGLATRHAWAQRQYAALHADLIEAQLTARARSMERAEERRAHARAWIPAKARLKAMLRARHASSARRAEPTPHCSRAAARSAHAARLAGGTR